MSTRTVLACASGVLLVGAAAALFAAGPDYTTIPPGAGEVEAMLKGKQIDLPQAIETARKTVGGVVTSASYDLTKQAASINLTVFAEGKRHNLVIDATGGSVMSDEIVPRFPGEPVEGDWIETDSGLKYFDIVEGDGPQPADPIATVTVHYTGWLVDGTKFDSSVDRGQPVTFPLARVVPGWAEGVGSMCVGGKRKLIIPHDLAYGDRGAPPVIPPKATLIFDIELLEIVEE